MTNRKLTALDRVLAQLDQGLRTAFSGAPQPGRKSPADTLADADLSDKDRAHAIGLMRINHTGEVCAQALYQGQALTAKDAEVQRSLNQAACPNAQRNVFD